MRTGKSEAFRVIVNDDFDSHLDFDDAVFDLWGRTAATTYSLCIGGDVLNYPSTVRATLAANVGRAHEEGRIPNERVQYWYEFLAAGGKDPLEMAIEGCRRNGMEIFASLRMNDIHHGKDPDDPVLRLFVSPFWREHPEYRAKGWQREKEAAFKGEYPEYMKERWDWRTWASYSFEHEAVRQRVVDVVAEVTEQYDVDGFDLDFSRTPPFFDRGRGFECRHHMTDVVRRAREVVDAASQRKGKPVKLSASCRSTIAASEHEGVDVRTWVNEGLVDILLPCQDAGSGTDVPVEEFAELAKGTETQICPNTDNVIRPGTTANIYVTAAVLRATALRCHRSGADGMQLFNFFCINELGNFETQIYKEGVFSEIGDADALQGRDTYSVCRQGLPVPLTGGEPASRPEGREHYWLTLPLDRRVPPPAPGRRTSGQATYRFSIADDIEGARAKGTLAAQKLTFSIVHAGPQDTIRFALNGEAIGNAAVAALCRDGDPLPAYRFFPPRMDYEVDLSKLSAVRNGWNTLEIKAVKLIQQTGPDGRFAGLDAQLYDVELSLRYK